MGRLRQVALWVLGRRQRVRVVGRSMEPTFADGAFVLVDPRAYEVRLPVVGDIVTCRHPFRGDLAMIKRVAAVDPQGRLTLLGDNASASTDSRTLGPVAADAVFGRVTALLA